jgi:succinate dehydrogenase / fumarate reductase flavoprotein subunit
MNLDGKCPSGPLGDRWTKHKGEMSLVAPHNRRKHKVIVVGSGLAGASAASTLAEQGYQVLNFTIQDSPRRSHSHRGPGRHQRGQELPERRRQRSGACSTTRSRAVTTAPARRTCYRLAEVSTNIIDQCVAQGVPFAREYGGFLANRSFGGAQVSRTFYARGQTGSAAAARGLLVLEPPGGQSGAVEMHTRREMLDVVVVDGKARGIVTRNLVTGEIERTPPTPC